MAAFDWTIGHVSKYLCDTEERFNEQMTNKQKL